MMRTKIVRLSSADDPMPENARIFHAMSVSQLTMSDWVIEIISVLQLPRRRTVIPLFNHQNSSGLDLAGS